MRLLKQIRALATAPIDYEVYQARFQRGGKA